MDHAFWQERWRENRIAFHEGEPNALLVEFISSLDLNDGDRVFVPLCGKAVDLDWLLAQGFNVVGSELNEGAVREVFERLGLEPVIEDVDELKRFRADQLVIYVGDFFKLTTDILGPVDAVYDRAALVAMPPQMRFGYAKHLQTITNVKRQLIIAYDYNPRLMDGPPFTVPSERIHGYYSGSFDIDLLSDGPISGPLSDRVKGQEQVWLLTPKDSASD